MDGTADELAGVVDLFGGLTRAELEQALTEIAYRSDGQDLDETAAEAAVDSALESFALVRYEDQRAIPEEDGSTEDPLLIAGPTAFPRTPEHAEDVPHILDVTERQIDREAAGKAAQERFIDVVDSSLSGNETESAHLEHLVDVSYDLEAWAPLDLSDERARLTDALDEE
ncbi:DUF7109 family protein [Natronosalvus amylolyticus]|uniref:DUF7109 family protein n=1 Tax=Natronosalvus amylolyticus TaxID=2961994 RepID=UPI0020C9E2E9|nr:hypothetical protein [Natronosalvus amylolyticus]